MPQAGRSRLAELSRLAESLANWLTAERTMRFPEMPSHLVSADIAEGFQAVRTLIHMRFPR